jgi:post-segregation antitoxin (ccd killing protein)
VGVATLSVDVSDELAAEVRSAGINVSQIVQEALRVELAARRTGVWR